MCRPVSGQAPARSAGGVFHIKKPAGSKPGGLLHFRPDVGLAIPILGIASYFRGRMQADPALPTVNRGQATADNAIFECR